MLPSHAPTVVLLSQGDELTAGRTTDANAPWIARQMTELGFRVVGIECCPDDPQRLLQALQRSASCADVVISTGGLGPTQDDHTTACAATWAQKKLELHGPSLERIRTIWSSRGLPMPASNKKQAMLPEGCEVLENNLGTAPGFALQHDECTAYFLPGPPREMQGLFKEHLQGRFLSHPKADRKHRSILRCVGISESRLQEKLNELDTPEGIEIHYKATLTENQIILDAPQSVATLDFQKHAQKCASKIGASCLGIDTPPLAELLLERLRAKNETLSVAESCTGGRISSAITAIPGASAVFLEGSCVYSNEAKIRNCGIKQEQLVTHGAVSESVAKSLARGIRERAGSTYGIGVTGIAGPGGGSKDKPVGTVHVALATPNDIFHRQLSLTGMRRDRVIALTTSLSLDLLRRHLHSSSH